MAAPLLLLGVGQVGMSLAHACRGQRRVIGTTRDPQRLFDLFHEQIEPIVMPWPSAEVIAPLADEADVVVSFPPNGTADAILAPACLNARSLVYVSSTAVYGQREGTIDDTTPVDLSDERAALRVEAEKIWRSLGANVVRVPAIYSPDSGLHKRLQEGEYKLPGDGSNMVSRIHLTDLTAIILALLASGKQGETYVVGDMEPASHRETVEWLCKRLALPFPESVPLDAVHYTQRGNRAVDPRRALSQLEVTLKYPTYREGFEDCLMEATEETA